MSVIVTNAKNRIAYAIVKSLGEKGIPVYTADFVPLSMAFSSRYSKGHFIYPSPFKDPEKFIESMVEHCRRYHAEVLMPVFEETFLLAKHKDYILQHVKMVIPGYDQVLTAHNKDRWLPIAKKLQIPVPATVDLSTLLSDCGAVAHLRFPVLIKPKQGGGAWGITTAYTAEEMDKLFTIHPLYRRYSPERFLVQEKLEGEVLCVAMLFSSGTPKALVTYKQLRDYPATGGQATLRESVKHQQAESHLATLLKELNWHGVCQADFLVEQSTGIPYLIDLNPRLWGSLTQAIASGVDFPYLMYLLALRGEVEPVLDFKTGVRTRWLWGDLRTFPQAFKCAPKKIKFLKEYLTLSDGVIYDVFSLKDPMPFFTFGIDALIKMITRRTLHPSSHDSLEGLWK